MHFILHAVCKLNIIDDCAEDWKTTFCCIHALFPEYAHEVDCINATRELTMQSTVRERPNAFNLAPRVLCDSLRFAIAMPITDPRNH